MPGKTDQTLRAADIEDLAVQRNILAVKARTFLCDHMSVQTGACSEYKSMGSVSEDQCRESCQLIASFCAQIQKNPPPMATPNGVQTIIKLRGNLSVCLKVVRDPTMQTRSRKSIQTLWDILNGKKGLQRAKQQHALRTQFVTVYDMFDHNGNLYIVMEAMTGDGMHFVTQYKDILPDAVYRNHIDAGWRALLHGLVDGLFSGGLFFGDVKPQNIAYIENRDKSFTFKWIDVECIDNKMNGCFQIDYLDLYHLDMETGIVPAAEDVIFFTDLWKVGLSILTMLTGTNPVTTLLGKSCRTCTDFSSLLYMKNNLNLFKEVVAAEVQTILADPNLPADTRRNIRSFLDPDGPTRLKPVLA